jgi:hypothetical protein
MPASYPRSPARASVSGGTPRRGGLRRAEAHWKGWSARGRGARAGWMGAARGQEGDVLAQARLRAPVPSRGGIRRPQARGCLVSPGVWDALSQVAALVFNRRRG